MGNRLPSAYQEVEYLESSGTQWIDTGISSITNCEIGLIVQQTQLNSGFPTMLGSYVENNFKNVFAYSSSMFYSQTTPSGSSPASIETGIQPDLAKHTFIYNANGNNVSIKLDTNTYSATYSSISVDNYNLFLFARNTGSSVTNFTNQKVFNMWEKVNEQYIHNFIPCYRKSDNVAGMYDIVNNVFYTNANTSSPTDFAVGPAVKYGKDVSCKGSVILYEKPRLPSGYTEVEYLQSSGTQYIDTGEKPNQDTNITISYSNFGSRAGYLFGAYPQNNYTNSYGYYLNTTSDGGNPFWHFNQNVRVLLPFKQSAIIKVLNKELYVDDEKQLTYSGQDFSCSLNLYLFAGNGMSTAWAISSKINYCKIWDGTTLVRHFIPCYNSNNVAGMYDISKSLPTQDLEGNCTQATTPTPTSPVEVVGVTDSGITLYGIGNYKDTFDKATGKITRKVGVLNLKNYTWFKAGSGVFYTNISSVGNYSSKTCFCNLITGILSVAGTTQLNNNTCCINTSGTQIYIRYDTLTDVASFNAMIQAQDSAVLYYILSTETYEYPNFYTNSGTGTFTYGQAITPLKQVKTYKSYICKEVNGVKTMIPIKKEIIHYEEGE